MTRYTSRRNFCQAIALAGFQTATVAAVGRQTDETLKPGHVRPQAYRYCLNTSTIRGQNLSLPDQIRIAAQAGYDAIEPWMRDIHRFIEQGGKLQDLRRLIDDTGLEICSAIGFASWIVPDPEQRAQGLKSVERDLEVLSALGAKRLAAPPVGATDRSDIPLGAIVERYGRLLELSDRFGVVPQLELWGFSRTLSRLGEVAYVVAETAHPKACALLDVYHIYKGGSDFAGLRLFSPAVLQVLHMNDYPADPPRAQINDSHRVYPGDGVAPLKQILHWMGEGGCFPVLSLELFNAEYWKHDALHVARTGLQKMQRVVEQAWQTAND
ncbi:MAG: xylose isomerase [Pirellulaceae bacterium]|nr:MAG: xylose isomerase [Pirellulaceae bacterium]